jgi:uncharacterized protein involved in type VI secretion and phage assembly
VEPEAVEQLLDWARSRYFSKYRGTVKDNADPTNRGRLKVEVPAVLGTLTAWAMPCVPYAGKGVGFYSLPEAGTGVWVEFEAGDPSYPIWTGCFWADNELPDKGGAAVKIWKTDEVTVRVDDKAKELKAEVSGGAKLTMKKDAETKAGENTHTVSSNGVVSKVGKNKAEISSKSFSVNDGALEVM